MEHRWGDNWNKESRVRVGETLSTVRLVRIELLKQFVVQQMHKYIIRRYN